MTDDPKLRRRWYRRAGLLAMTFAAGIAAIAVVVHTPPVRRLALSYVAAEVQQRYGVRIDAVRLDYNLAALRVGLAGLRVAADTSPDLPFFEADYVAISLPRRVLAGVVAFDDVRITNGRVRIVRGRDGRTNLPTSGESSTGEPPALDIAHMSAPRLVVEVRDAQADAAIAVPGISLDIGQHSGTVSLNAPATISLGARRSRVSTLDGGLAFDGRAVTLASVQLRADEGAVQLDGRLSVITTEPSIDLRAAGTADVQRLARWGLDGEQLPRGAIDLDAHAAGPLSSPIIDLRLRSASVAWPMAAASGSPTLVVTDLSSTSRVTTTGVDVQQLSLGLAGGTVNGAGTLPFDETQAHARATWNDVDAFGLVNQLAGAVALAPVGRLSGDLEASGPLAQLSKGTADIRVHVGSGGNSRGRVAIPGDTRLSLRDGRWRVDAHHRAGGVIPIDVVASGRFDAAAVANSSIDGRVNVASTRVPAAVDVLRTTGLADVPADAVSDGTLSATATLTGRLVSPQVSAQAEVRDVIGSRARVQTVTASVTGEPLQSRLTFALRAPEVVIADQPLRDVQLTGRLANDDIDIESLAAAQGGGAGTLSGSGRYNLSTQAYVATFATSRWEVVSDGKQAFNGEVAATFQGAGTVAEPSGSGSLRLSAASWGTTSLGDVTADLQLDGRTAVVRAQANAFNATLTARAAVKAPYVTTADLRVDSVDLTKLTVAAPPPVPITGLASLTAHAEGPAQMWRDASAQLDLTVLEAKAGDLSIRLPEPSHIRYEQRQVRVDRLEVDAGATRLSASGQMPLEGGSGTLDVTALGDVGEAARAVAAMGLTQVPLTNGSGPVAVLARITGSIATPVVTADMEVGPAAVTVENLSPLTGLTLRAHFEHDSLDLREAHANYEGATLDATGSLPVAFLTSGPARGTLPASLHATATGITPAVFRGVLDPATLAQIGGTVDASLNLQAPARDPALVTGDLTLSRLDLQVAGLSVTQRAPTRIVARDGFARVESWNWAGEAATLGVFGQVRLADRQAALIANGDIDLRVVTPFVRDAGLATGGRLTPRISVTGPIDVPRIDGDVALESGEIRLTDPRIVVNGLTARALLTRTTATLASLNGSMNGGALTGQGTLSYEPGAGLSGRLAVDVDDMALEFPIGLRSELNAMLQLDMAPAADHGAPAGLLSGTVTMLRGAYREPIAVVGGLLAAVRARSAASTGGPSTDDQLSLLKQLALDVRVQTDDDLIVDNNYARLQMGTDVDVIGTAAAPGMSGRAVLREDGRLFIGRNVYTIAADTPSTIDFVSPNAIEPELNVHVTTRVSGEDIDVTLTGPAEAPQVAMSSTSGLGQADITALLLTGRTLDALSTADASFIGTQVIGNLSGEVLGFAGRAVGLDTLRLGGIDDTVRRLDPGAVATEVNPTSRLTFGKSFGPNADVTFSQSLLNSTAQTWIVEYLPARRVYLRLISGDNNLFSYEFRHEVSFGQRPRIERVVPPVRTEVHVTGVSVTGELAFPEERIRRILKLRDGDRFDFARWQDDRDRLEDFYHQNGHLAARVSASRATDGESVALSYVVDAGPETAIVVSGADLGRGVVQQLSDAWVTSFFDELLIDDATRIVKGALTQQGYLQPVVTSRVTADGGMKTLLVDVQPGAKTGDVRIEIQGPVGELGQALQSRVSEPRLVAQAVVAPGFVTQDLTEFLRSRGYMRVKVVAGLSQTRAATTVVPFSVDPGPEFIVGGVTVQGRQGLSEDEVAEEVAIAIGSPFNPSAVDQARDRLLALYRRRGFASATVNAGAAVQPEGPRVDVTFQVREGARQAIGAIVVTGNTGIDADVVTGALRLSTGEPLEPEELVRARTRIYNTGLFRRVDVTTQAMDRNGDALQPMRVLVNVDAWPALRLRYGFQAAEERPEGDPTGRELEPGLLADLTRRTLFGRAVSLDGSVQYQRHQNTERALVSTPTLWSLPILSSLVLQHQHEESLVSNFVTNVNSVSWEQQLRASHLTLLYSYQFGRNHTFDTVRELGSGLNLDIRIRVARLNGTTVWDTRNDQLDATRGTLVSSTVEWAPESLGSQFRFLKYVGQAYRFQNVRGVVLASAARLGLARALGGQDFLISERFFAGGSRTVRGVAEDSLGPRDIFGDPSGGEAMLILNQEARVPLYKRLGGVAFIDAGNVFGHPNEIRLKELTGAIGVGLRLNTPFALLRVDYGRVVWRGLPATGTLTDRWFIGIGQAF